MDGNGRWAKKRGLPRKEGHRRGAETARKITRAAGRMEISFLTLYALSTENLYRPQAELDALMNLMRHYLEDEVPELIKNRIRLRIIGDRSVLPKDVRKKILISEEETALSYDMTLVLALGYGGRDDIIRAVKKIAREGKIEDLTEKRLSAALDTGDMPDPDLVIRTGGDHRLSNFLTWQTTYSELYFTKTLWPDFSPAHLKRAVESFHKRQRRFGRTDEAVTAAPAPSKKKGKLR